MLTELMLASMLLASPAPETSSFQEIITEAKFVDIVETEDLSFLKNSSVSILGDSISSYTGVSISGGSDAVYPDNYVTDSSQMWWSDLHPTSVSAVAGSYVHHREDGDYVNFNSDIRVGFLGDAAYCIIYGGTCDLLANVLLSDFEGSLQSLVSNVQFGGLRSTVLCTLPPIKNANANGDDYKDFNDVIRKVAKNTGSHLCEFSTAWEANEIDDCTEDGIHPNAEGMSRLAKLFD